MVMSLRQFALQHLVSTWMSFRELLLIPPPFQFLTIQLLSHEFYSLTIRDPLLPIYLKRQAERKTYWVAVQVNEE
jgi:hypothetical protein